MFRRLSNTLPKDFAFPADLEQLGYFINESDQIRMIRKPEQRYQYVINKNERVNEAYKQAMISKSAVEASRLRGMAADYNALSACIRRIVLSRLRALGLQHLRLPIGAAANENNVPILVSSDLSQKKRVLVLLTERNQDLGIFSYRTIGDEGINKGSAVDLVSAVIQGEASADGEPTPGIILANPGQLLWYRGGARAVGRTEWTNLPRESAVHQDMRVDEVKNKIPCNLDEEDHVRYIFEHVIDAMVANDVKVDVIGWEWTGLAALRYLATNCTSIRLDQLASQIAKTPFIGSKWSQRISAVCLLSPQHDLDDLNVNESGSGTFVEFVAKYCRAYSVSSSPLATLMTGRRLYGCNCYASGEEYYPECVFIRAWGNILDWLKQVHANPFLREIDFVIEEDETPELSNWENAST